MSEQSALSQSEIEALRAEDYKRVTKYGISLETLRIASGCDEQTISRALETGELPRDAPRYMSLGNVLGWLSGLMLRYIDDPAEHLQSLMSSLRQLNGVSYDTVAKIADIGGVDSGVIERAFLGKAKGETADALTVAQEYRLFRVASMLNGILNKNEPWPWT